MRLKYKKSAGYVQVSQVRIIIVYGLKMYQCQDQFNARQILVHVCVQMQRGLSILQSYASYASVITCKTVASYKMMKLLLLLAAQATQAKKQQKTSKHSLVHSYKTQPFFFLILLSAYCHILYNSVYCTGVRCLILFFFAGR